MAKEGAPSFHLGETHWLTAQPGLLLNMLMEKHQMEMPVAMALSLFWSCNFRNGDRLLDLMLKVFRLLPVETVIAASDEPSVDSSKAIGNASICSPGGTAGY